MALSRGSPPAEDLGDLFENAPCGYLVMSPDGAITRLNATLAGWLGIPAADLLGKRFSELLTTPGRIVYETNLAPLLRLQSGFEEVVLDLVTGTGEKLPVQINAAGRRNADGDLVVVRVAIFRATGRRRYERDLQFREAAAIRDLVDERAASELREQFIAVLGHDLRNPLAAIVGAARLLRREVQSDRALKILEMMEASVGRMAGLIDDVMDFARGRLGSGIGVHRSIAALDVVLRHVVDELQAGDPGRTIVCEFDLPAPISVDEGRIAQLVSNLLGNALAHGDAREPVRLHASTSDDQLTLWVSNAGAPIPQAAMERLFQPFFRGEVRPGQQGLGLGLHIASEIAKAHGGRLQVQSDQDETRFTLVMPLV
jgi:sigma-B regulation protein RsbU (phosphoserine phosphatase)